jgi:hypothetical protein
LTMGRTSTQTASCACAAPHIASNRSSNGNGQSIDVRS